MLASTKADPSADNLKAIVQLARSEKSPVVLLYLASLTQKLAPENRWDILSALTSHSEDAADHNLPLMYWYAIEPLAAHDTERAARWLPQIKIPLVRQFLARRIVSLDDEGFNAGKATAALDRLLQTVDFDLARELSQLLWLHQAPPMGVERLEQRRGETA